MPHYFNILIGLFSEIHKILDHYVFHAYHQLADVLRYPIALSVTLYIVLLGYSISQGWVSLSISHIVKVTLKIAIIYTFAMNWDFFSRTVVDFIQGGSNQLGGLLLQGNQHGLDTQAGVEGALQSVLKHFTKIGYWCWRRATWHSFGPYFEAIVIWGSGIALVIYSAIQLLVSDIMLSILLSLAPLFVAFTVFKKTQYLFDRWVGYLISYALLILFVSVLLCFVLSICEWATSGMTDKNIMSTMFITSFAPIVLVCFISMALIRRVAKMAYDIGMGVSSMASSEGWGSRVGETLNFSLPTIKDQKGFSAELHQSRPLPNSYYNDGEKNGAE